MTEASLSAGVGPLLLVVGFATLIIAALTLWNTRSSVGLSEYRAGHLRRERPHLLALLREERETLREEMEQEWERYLLEARQRDERSSRELLLLRREQERLAEELRRESERREQERRARLETEARIGQLEREIEKLQKAQRASSSLVSVGTLEGRIEARKLPREEPLPAREAWGGAGATPPAGPTGAAPEPTRVPPRDKRPGLGVWHPHPDDNAGMGDASAGRDRERSGAPVEMFRKHYGKYLENYRGYVELAEELYRMRNAGEVASGPLGEREWEERLRRVKDGLERTTARLDILEQHNPELVADASISHRASVARRHAQLF